MTKKKNPYTNLPSKNFWKPSIGDLNQFDITDIWKSKFKLTKKTKFTTYGSCFAQNFSNALKSNDLNWVESEVPPTSKISKSLLKKYNYSIYSSRTQNIYTPSMLNQLLILATTKKIFNEYWKTKNRFYDPLRPTVEPNGFNSKSEMLCSRNIMLKSLIKSIEDCDVFVFTLGLTERWVNKKNGYEYAVCPGTVGGEFNEKLHAFSNLNNSDLYKELKSAIEIIRSINPHVKILLTVSPVPLVATYENKHVLVSTISSKCSLRSTVDRFITRSYVDYFPSFELISSFPFRGMFYEKNMRNINHQGVNFVMNHFFNGADIKTNKPKMSIPDIKCEEELLEAFIK